MKLRTALLLLVVSVVFIVGCAQGDDLVSGPFVGGTNGLTIGFGTNAPPDRVFDNDKEDFDISIELKNVGEYDIPTNKVIITLSGVDVRDFRVPSAHMILDRPLEGKDEFQGRVIDGDEDELIYESAQYQFDLDADWETTIRADICYEYQTRATTKVCSGYYY